MGIEGLWDGIKSKTPASIRENVLLTIFAGHKFALDVSLCAYTFMYAGRCEVLKYMTDIIYTDPDPKIVRSAWLKVCFEYLMIFIECDITIVPVFEGPHFRLKMDTKEDRTAVKETRTHKIADLRYRLAQDPTNSDLLSDLKKELQSDISFCKEDWVALHDMMLKMGLPVIDGKYEAEAVCARLARSKLVSGVISKDGDCLAHGCPIMIKNVKRGPKRVVPKHICTVILLDDIMSALEVTKDQFIDLCILSGSDYAPRMPKCGFKTAHKHIKKGDNFNAIVEIWNKKYETNEQHIFNDIEIVNEIRGYFKDDLDDCLPEFPLVHNYNSGLGNWFETVLVGWTKDLFLKRLNESVDKLRQFNQKFAALQNFILVNKDVESQCSNSNHNEN